MKKTMFGLSVALIAFGFLVSPVLAAGPRQQEERVLTAADQAFLISLAAQAPKAPAARRASAGAEKSLCNATANCGGGVTVSCSGNASVTSCSAADRNCGVGEQGHVTCDGVTTWCPGTCSGCPADWCTYQQDCADSCYPCAFTYTCIQSSCTDRCRCKFATCPV